MVNLLLGAGNSREKRMTRDGNAQWVGPLVTHDMDPSCDPDVVHNLRFFPWPWKDNTFIEIHAYEILEHIHHQGDYEAFFAVWEELHRILIPGGAVFASTPAWDSVWAWGDPGHTAVYNEGTLVFLSQREYEKQVGDTPMTDYRSVYSADFDRVMVEKNGENFYFILQAVK